ncbi:Mitochondrial inner membrane protease atp23 [Sorochytrium milnesiophthora]
MLRSDPLEDKTGEQSPATTGAAEDDSTAVVTRWRRRFGALTGVGMSAEDRARYDREQAHLASEKQYERCEQWKTELMRHSPIVRFMLQHLEAAGCPFTRRNMICQPCDATRSGGFAPEYGVVLCENRFISKSHMEDTLTHELIHALDHCRAKLDWSNCRHHACTEIRAASLSGDCRWTNELLRGNWKVTKQHQACVKRRAVLSLKDNPACSAPGVAEDAVAEVWDKCFGDKFPFDEIYK